MTLNAPGWSGFANVGRSYLRVEVGSEPLHPMRLRGRALGCYPPLSADWVGHIRTWHAVRLPENSLPLPVTCLRAPLPVTCRPIVCAP